MDVISWIEYAYQNEKKKNQGVPPHFRTWGINWVPEVRHLSKNKWNVKTMWLCGYVAIIRNKNSIEKKNQKLCISRLKTKTKIKFSFPR